MIGRCAIVIVAVVRLVKTSQRLRDVFFLRKCSGLFSRSLLNRPSSFSQLDFDAEAPAKFRPNGGTKCKLSNRPQESNSSGSDHLALRSRRGVVQIGRRAAIGVRAQGGGNGCRGQ
jgi:hypothetical protein